MNEISQAQCSTESVESKAQTLNRINQKHSEASQSREENLVDVNEVSNKNNAKNTQERKVRRKLPALPTESRRFIPQTNYSVTSYQNKTEQNKVTNPVRQRSIKSTNRSNIFKIFTNSLTFDRISERRDFTDSRSDVHAVPHFHAFQKDECLVVGNVYVTPIATEYSTFFKDNVRKSGEEFRLDESFDDFVRSNYCENCANRLRKLFSETKDGLTACGAFLRQVLPRSRSGHLTITGIRETFQGVYLGNVITILFKGEGATDIAFKRIWKSCHQGRISVQIIVQLRQKELVLSSKHKLMNRFSQKTRTACTIENVFNYRRITFCEVSKHNRRVVAWIYRHKCKFKTVRLVCHAVLLPTRRRAEKIVELVNLKRQIAILNHHRLVSQSSARRILAPSSSYQKPSLKRREWKYVTESHRTLFPILENHVT